ncbi:hypothetical protein SVA_0925 [Sulfurifustis variabilis]|uniref:Uncharacterized protein n=1 Tax=Sulfurifustis variabilis TaxID=1675686 RepID=A0A1B4V7Z4_9GAMM|nr:hypothetical protein [Sulfurifustis variabilis]BAU47504.1 hypothetical protein SVA_0925 [Sulfurifustis variabilis]
MTALVLIAIVAGMLLAPARVLGAESTYDERFIAPAVVTQGEFAVHLALALGIRPAQDAEPEQAMRKLAALGIEPLDGWSAGAPMTPQTAADLRQAVLNAAAAGRLEMEPATARAVFSGLLAELGLPLPAAPPAAYAGRTSPPDRCDRAALDYYYGAVGVPYYTYCAPPPAYYHLYAWVPSRFYWHGHFFGGFFVIRDVHVVVPHVKKHRVPRPRFSEGVIGERRHARPPSVHVAPRDRPRFSDGALGDKRGSTGSTIHTPAQALPDGGNRPRHSTGVLDGKRGFAAATRPPPAASRPAPRVGRAMPAPAPRSNAGPVIRSPSPSPSAGPATLGRGWRHVVPGRR